MTRGEAPSTAEALVLWDKLLEARAVTKGIHPKLVEFLAGVATAHKPSASTKLVAGSLLHAWTYGIVTISYDDERLRTGLPTIPETHAWLVDAGMLETAYMHAIDNNGYMLYTKIARLSAVGCTLFPYLHAQVHGHSKNKGVLRVATPPDTSASWPGVQAATPVAVRAALELWKDRGMLRAEAARFPVTNILQFVLFRSACTGCTWLQDSEYGGRGTVLMPVPGRSIPQEMRAELQEASARVWTATLLAEYEGNRRK
ncbi:hypothetical protein EBT31_06185 [bacterium]|nr:hypothetical protein [bacterium]